jgi:hypothetical protein
MNPSLACFLLTFIPAFMLIAYAFGSLGRIFAYAVIVLIFSLMAAPFALLSVVIYQLAIR